MSDDTSLSECQNTPISKEMDSMTEDIQSKLKLDQDDDIQANRKIKICYLSSGRPSTTVPETSESEKSCSVNKKDAIPADTLSKIKTEVTEQFDGNEFLSDSESNGQQNRSYHQPLCPPVTEGSPVLSLQPTNIKLKYPDLSQSERSTVVVEGEAPESEKANLGDEEEILADSANPILFKMQLKGVYEKFKEECFAYCDTKAEETINITAKIENVVDNLLQKTDWITEDISIMSEDRLNEYMYEYVDSCFHPDLFVLVDRAVDTKVDFFLRSSEEEFDSYFGISKPEEVYPETSSEITVIDLDIKVECDTNDPQEGEDGNSSDIETDEEEEESPAFEKIGETPPPSPQKLNENTESSPNLLGLNDPVVTPPDTQIPEDIDASPVYYLELSDMFAEKLKFFKEMKLEHQDDSSDE